MTSRRYDPTLRELIERYGVSWASLLGPWTIPHGDWIDADVSTVTAAADKVLRVRGTPFEWLLNLEVQSSWESGLPERLHTYSTLLRARHGLLVRSVLLLLRREANASDLTGRLALKFPDDPEPYDTFRYHVVRAWELPVEPWLTGSVGRMPLALLTDEAAKDPALVVERLANRLRAETAPAERDQLLAATAVLMGLRYSSEVTQHLLRGVVTMEESVVYQAIMAKGALREARKLVLRIGQHRFGPPDATVTAIVEATTDLERLEQMAVAAHEVSSWAEVLAAPSS